MAVAGERSRQALRDAGARTLVWDRSGRGWTGEALLRRVGGLASALQRRGLSGRRVGLWLWNAPAAIEAHLAVEWIGGTRVPVDPSAPPAEAQAVWDAAQVDAVVTDGAHADGDALVHDDEQPLAATGAPDPATVDPETTHLLYPRMAAGGQLLAVPVSYRNWAAQMDLNLALYRSGWYGRPLADDDRFVTAQQLPHGTGLVGTFPFLLAGLPQVVLRTFDAEAFVEAVLRHDATSTFFVPGMVTRVVGVLAAQPGTRLPLRRVLYGGAPFPPQDMRAAVDRLGPVLVQLYGRFEGGWPLTVLGTDDHARIAEGDDALARSCGRPVPGVELAVRPAPSAVAGAGELRVRGDTVVAEYADPDGWCALGDLVTVDEQGYLSLHGRVDGMINTGSYHVYPAEVEEAIRALPGVEAVLVRGEPDPVWGQAVTASVVATEPLDAERLRTLLAGRLARYKIPKRFSFVDTLPS